MLAKQSWRELSCFNDEVTGITFATTVESTELVFPTGKSELRMDCDNCVACPQF